MTLFLCSHVGGTNNNISLDMIVIDEVLTTHQPFYKSKLSSKAPAPLLPSPLEISRATFWKSRLQRKFYADSDPVMSVCYNCRCSAKTHVRYIVIEVRGVHMSLVEGLHTLVLLHQYSVSEKRR